MTTAQAMFLRDGFHATTMDRIAETAAVSKATLYKYFPDKDELFFALVREARLAPSPRLIEKHREMIEQIVDHLKHHRSRAKVKDAILEHFQAGAQRRNDAFFRLMFELGFARPALLRRVTQELHGQSGGFHGMTEAAAKELPPDVDGQALLHLLFVAITGYTLLEDVVFGPERIDPERLADTLAALICAAFE